MLHKYSFSGFISSPSNVYTNNISYDPKFADAAGGDFHLKSPDGRWDPDIPDWVITDSDYSLCLVRGRPGSAYGQEPADNGGIVNMGAYGNTGEASKLIASNKAYLNVGLWPTEVLALGAQWQFSFEESDVWHNGYNSGAPHGPQVLVEGSYYLGGSSVTGYNTPYDLIPASPGTRPTYLTYSPI